MINRKRLAIVVEGDTEYRFVNKMLKEELKNFFWIYPINLRGGRISVDKIQNNVLNLISNFDYITTLVDYYGFANPHRTQTVDELQARMRCEIKSNNFIPYIQQYEFESLVFSSIQAIESKFGKLGKFRRNVEPEQINHDHPPSKILKDNFPAWNKVIDANGLLTTIGIETIRRKCPRFSQWLDDLKALNNDTKK